MNAQAQEKEKMTPGEYLEFERNSKIKHEYLDGDIFAMVGAKKNHNIINTNIVRELGNRFITDDSTCRVFANDMRVKIQENGKYTYPDILVACGNIEFEDQKFDILMNPVVIVEILSDSTEAYDRGKKFQHYQRIPSLQEYILVSQNYCLVEKYIRSDDGSWKYTAFSGMEQIMQVESIECELSLSEIYRWVEF